AVREHHLDPLTDQIAREAGPGLQASDVVETADLVVVDREVERGDVLIVVPGTLDAGDVGLEPGRVQAPAQHDELALSPAEPEVVDEQQCLDPLAGHESPSRARIRCSAIARPAG